MANSGMALAALLGPSHAIVTNVVGSNLPKPHVHLVEWHSPSLMNYMTFQCFKTKELAEEFAALKREKGNIATVTSCVVNSDKDTTELFKVEGKTRKKKTAEPAAKRQKHSSS